MTELQKAIKWLEEMEKQNRLWEQIFYLKKPESSEYGDNAANCRALLDALRWIPVSDRLPTDDDADEKGNVLCYWTDEAIETYQARWVDEWNSDRNHKDKITHWRPLPAPPERSERDDG